MEEGSPSWRQSLCWASWEPREQLVLTEFGDIVVNQLTWLWLDLDEENMDDEHNFGNDFNLNVL